MDDLTCSLLVLGAGPGGYVCAIRAGQLGIDTVVVEADNAGGTCLNVGCIPSKALIHAADEFYKLRCLSRLQNTEGNHTSLGITASNAAIDLAKTVSWKDGIVKRLTSGVSGLLKKAGVRYIQGSARFRDGKNVMVTGATGEIRISAENIVIATGSEAIELSSLPFGGNILSSTEALSLPEPPGKLAVVGGGYIGLEIGTAFAKLGTEVSIIEAADSILPQYDAALTQPIKQRLDTLGVKLYCQTSALSYDSQNALLQTQSADGQTANVNADKVLVTAGRRARLHGWGLTELSLTTEAAYLQVDTHCQTSMRGVFAVGDVTGEPMLAHRAMAQGELVAEIIAGHTRVWDKACIPAVCFTDPEIVSVGDTVEQAEARGLVINVSEFPFRANARAMSTEREDGFIRVIARDEDHAIIGIQAVGAGIAELSAAFALAIEMGARVEDIAATVHAHPTISESFPEACMKMLGRSLHI